MKIKHIDGLLDIIRQLGVYWIPNAPVVSVDSTYTGTGIRIIIKKSNPTLGLYWNYKGKTKLATGLNKDYVVTLKEQGEEPYNVLVAYDTNTNQIEVYDSEYSLIPTELSLQDNEILISRFQISGIGEEVVIPPPTTTTIDPDKMKILTTFSTIVGDISPSTVDLTNELGAVLKGIDNLLTANKAALISLNTSVANLLSEITGLKNKVLPPRGEPFFWFNSFNEQTGKYLFEHEANIDSKEYCLVIGNSGKSYKLVKLYFLIRDYNNEIVGTPTIAIHKNKTTIFSSNKTLSVGLNDCLPNVIPQTAFINGDVLDVLVVTGTGTSNGSNIRGVLFWEMKEV